MKHLTSSLACTLFLAAGSASAADIALVGGDVYTVSGAMLPGATVVIRNQKIVAVGTDVPIATNARRIDCKGKRITPGFIESASSLGLVEISLESSTVDADIRKPDPIRAAARAADGVDLRSTLVGVARRHGVTSAISSPRGGLVSGQSAWLDLVDGASALAPEAVKGPVALTGNLGEAGAAAVYGSRAGAMLRFREVLDDARTYNRSKSAFQRNALYKMATSRLDLEALTLITNRRVPLVVRAHRASDIRAALAFAKEERIRIVISGGAEAWMVAKELADARVPVIVNSFADLPATFEQRYARADNATLLSRAGVDVAIATFSNHNVSNLRFYAANAVRAGMTPQAALRSITLTPAKIFGAEREYGSVERGRVANLVVWTGDPFEASSHAKHVMVRGELQPTASRQTHLAKKYIRHHKMVKAGSKAK